jgi:hypothetical protein
MLGRNDEADGKKESVDNPSFPDNPCIPYLRAVVEHLLVSRGIQYREMNLVIIDDSSYTREAESDLTSEEEALEKVDEVDNVDGAEKENAIIDCYQTSIWLAQRREYLDEQLDTVLSQLSEELNHLQIRTDRSAYFEEFCQSMFEENGLVVQVEGKEKRQFPRGSVVLDLETEGLMMSGLLREDIIYLPIYKKPWQIAPNLDITVPIGYNTVIVKGAIKQTVTSHSDKFEREFYDSGERI